MNMKKINNLINQLELTCKPFLTTDTLNDEQKQQLILTSNQTPLQTFNETIDKYKLDANLSPLEKKISILKSYYHVKFGPFEAEEISNSINNFLNTKINDQSLVVGENEIQTINKILDDINFISNAVHVQLQNLHVKSKKWYISNANKQNKLKKSLNKLNILELKIKFQREYHSKQIADNIIDNFYSIYVYLRFMIDVLINKDQQLLLIEIASFLDKYISIISYIFNNRKLNSIDMIYHYASFELNELKTYIYENLNDYKVLS